MFYRKNLTLLGTLLTIFFVFSMGADAWAGGTISGSISASAKLKKDCIVYIDNIPGQWPPTKGACIDQRCLAFVPQVLPVVVGTTVSFQNHDHIIHNVFSPDEIAEKFNLGTWPSGEIRTYTFAKTGSAALLCNLHTEMEGYVVVLQNPFFAKTDENGNYTIDNVPPGAYALKVWNKKLKGDPQYITVQEGCTVKADFELKK